MGMFGLDGGLRQRADNGRDRVCCDRRGGQGAVPADDPRPAEQRGAQRGDGGVQRSATGESGRGREKSRELDLE